MAESERPNEGELILYQTQEGAVRIEVLYESETFWLNQKKIAELFGVDLRTISYHLNEIYDSGEVKLRPTRQRGALPRRSLLRRGGLEIAGRPTMANVRMCRRSMEMRLALPMPRAVREKDSRARTVECRQAISRRPPHNSLNTTPAIIAD